MIGQGVARRYAQALFELASERAVLEAVEADLEKVVTTIEKEPDLRKTLHHPLISVPEKTRLVEAVFGADLSGLALNFLRFVVRKKREAVLAAILDEYRRLVHAARGITDAQVVLAAPADEGRLAALREALERSTGRRVRLAVTVDPALLGGMVVQIGDRRIDGSLRGRLARLRQEIANAPIRGA